VIKIWFSAASKRAREKTILDIYKISIAHPVFDDNEDGLKKHCKTFAIDCRKSGLLVKEI